MVKTGIKIFARLRPTKKTTSVYEVGENEDGQLLSFTLPRSESGGAVNNKREIYSFKFCQVFDCSVGQDVVFNAVSRDVIDNCLEGYNGTIFAYGQTGSGKTFTITGGVERYNERGLIPRALSYLFNQYQKSPGTIFTTHISYLEIYNESGYDLLDPRHETSRLEDLPKVTLMEDRESIIHLKNLSLQPANNEDEALNWLFLGDTNRVMAETPMNMASTRSHCIFTVHMSSRQPGSDIVRRAKLHLVDLAGSERVKKTGVDGTLLAEAKYINLSLHYLEQVIVALSDKSRSHIPYRNSMMTSVLRDSLGGNCMTSMIATCSIDKRNVEETISTCRFSQRVAMIKNEVSINEELDPKLMVQQLKQKVSELKDELKLATGGDDRDRELDDSERKSCEGLVEDYLKDSSPEARLLVGGDMRRIQYCFSLFKVKVQSLPVPRETTPTNRSQAVNSDPRKSRLEMRSNDEIIRQREQEINVLLKMLKHEQKKVGELEALLRENGVTQMKEEEEERVKRREEEEVVEVERRKCSEEKEQLIKSENSSMGGDIARSRQESFDQFRKHCPFMSNVNEHKSHLKMKYTEAKALGERVQQSRTIINELKSQLERHRISRGLKGLTRGVAGGVASEEDGPGEKEVELKTAIEKEKEKFKSQYQILRGMKIEIEHIQHLLHMAKVKVQQEFEVWWVAKQQQSLSEGVAEGVARTAWMTPPTATPSPKPHPSLISSRHINTDTSAHVPMETRTSIPPTEDPLVSEPLPTQTIVPLTGDPQADADILAFYSAKQKLLNNRDPR